MAEQILFEAKVNANQAEQELGKVNKGVKDTDAATKGLTNSLDKMTGGAVSGFKGMVKGVRSGIMAMKSLKVAIAATGLGLLVTTIGALVLAFQRNQEVADKLTPIFKGLGVIVDRLIDVVTNFVAALLEPQKALEDLGDMFSYYFEQFIPNAIDKVLGGLGKLGEAFKQLLSGDFSAAADTATEGVKQLTDGVTDLNPATAIIKAAAVEVGEFAKESGEAAMRVAELERAEQRLRDANIAAIRTDAELKKQIEEKRLAAEEESASVEDQIRLFQEADQLEQVLLNNKSARLQEEIRILKARQAESNNLAEDNRELAELESQLTEIEGKSASDRVRLNRRLNSLRKSAAAEQKKALEEQKKEREEYEKDLEKLRIDSITDEREKIVQENKLALEGIREKYGEGTELEKQLRAKQNAELAAFDAEVEEQEKEKERERIEKEREFENEQNLLKLENELMRERENAERKFELQRELAEQERQIALQNEELTAAERERIQLQYLDKLKNISDAEVKLAETTAETTRQQKQNETEAVIGAALTIAELAGANKEVAVATATIDTYAGASKALAQGGVAGIASAATVIAAGIANVNKIINTDIPDTTSSVSAPTGGGGGGGGANVSPQDLSAEALTQNEQFAAFREQGTAADTQQPIRAFVLEGEITDSQDTSKRIRQRARL